MNKKISPLYILPNLFTAASLYIGFLSIVYAFKGNFELACWLIFLATIFDGLDGRVARMTGTTSKFGVEFDSLADVISFGVAPAVILFFYTGQDYGKPGVLVSGLFALLGAVRLARFNVSIGEVEPNVFIGIPIPLAAVTLMMWLLIFIGYDVPREQNYILLILGMLLALLMVSNIRYPSFKKFDFRAKYKIRVFLGVVLFVSVIYLFPKEGIAFIATIFIISGIVRAAYYLLKRKNLNSKLTKD